MNLVGEQSGREPSLETLAELSRSFRAAYHPYLVSFSNESKSTNLSNFTGRRLLLCKILFSKTRTCSVDNVLPKLISKINRRKSLARAAVEIVTFPGTLYRVGRHDAAKVRQAQRVFGEVPPWKRSRTSAFLGKTIESKGLCRKRILTACRASPAMTTQQLRPRT